MYHSSGRPWTRQEVDEEGQLTMLRSSQHGWKIDSENQRALDDADEARFVSVSNLALPAYIDIQDRVYNRDGQLLPEHNRESVKNELTDELVHVRCPHQETACKMATLIRTVRADEDSIGGAVACMCTGVPPALGEPCFDKLEALMAHAMLSLPATKGFEIGSGFEGTKMRGSQHNDGFIRCNKINNGVNLIATRSNHAGGTLGGITSGADIVFRVAVKPVSTIGKAQDTADYNGNAAILEAKGRHDPCVLPRTPPLVEAMASLVLIDAALKQRTRIDTIGAATVPASAAHFVRDTSASANAVIEREGKRQKL